MNSAVTSTPETIVHADGVDLCVQTFGPPDAPPVLLVAGAASSMRYWDDEFCARLAAGPRFVLRYDHRDTGRSVTCPPGAPDYTAADLVDDVSALLDAHGIGRAHLVGLSMGGGLAQVVAMREPRRVASLTLLATSPAAPGADSDLPGMSEETQAEFGGLPEPDWADRDAVVEYLVEQERLCSARSVPFDSAGMRAAMARVVDRSNDVRAMFNHFAVIGSAPSWVGLGPVTAPTLVVHGAEDPVAPPAHGAALAAGIAGSRLRVVEGMGHEWPRRVWEPLLPDLLAHTARG